MFFVPPQPEKTAHDDYEQQDGKKITETMTAARGGFFQNRHTPNLPRPARRPKFEFASEPQHRVTD